MLENFIWSEKYRPKTVNDLILPEKLKKIFQSFVDQGEIPDMTLSGPSGSGKTTIARAMLDEMNRDYILINASLEGNIDTLRNKIHQFASSVSFKGGRKYVILDEADFMNQLSFQPALRGFLDEFSKNCGFILTCNQPSRIIPAIISRCPLIDFGLDRKEVPKLAAQFMRVLVNILEAENVKYDIQVLGELVKKYLPDWRQILNVVQKYAASGSIDTGILATLQDASISELMNLLKEKSFSGMRKWVGESIEGDYGSVYRQIYDTADTTFDKSSIPQVVLILAKYQYQHGFCVDQEINLVACLTEIMVEGAFK